MRKFLIAGALLLATITIKAQETSNPSGSQTRFLVSANVNYAYRLGETPDNVPEFTKDYLDDLKSGVSYDLAFYYKFHKYMGVGLRYNTFRSKASMSGVYAIAPNGEEGYTTMSDDIAISFYGPAFIFDKKMGLGYLTAEAALGYMDYKNKSHLLGDYTFTGETIGAIVGVSYNFEIFENFTIGPKISIVSGSITEFELKGPNGYNQTLERDGDDSESLWRFDAGVTAMYRF